MKKRSSDKKLKEFEEFLKKLATNFNNSINENYLNEKIYFEALIKQITNEADQLIKRIKKKIIEQVKKNQIFKKIIFKKLNLI